MLIAMLMQSAYALVNLIFVVELGDEAVSGLAISIQAFFIILAIGQVIGQTALADISQAYGRHDVERARSALTTYTILALGLGVLAMLAAWLGADLYVGLFTDDPRVHAEGVAYFEANAPTFLLQLLIIVLSTALRASGDFVTPMRIMVTSVILNAALDPVLMFALDMGIAGAAWATVIAQAVACLVYLTRLRPNARSDGRGISWGKPSFDREIFQRIAARGLPAGIQFFLIFVLLGVVLAGMKPHGTAWTGAAGGGFRVLQQCWLPLVTLASAAAAMAGQNFGARNIERVATTAAVALRWGLIFSVVGTIVVFAAAPLLAYIAGRGEEQHTYATRYFMWSAPMLLAFAFTYIPTFMLQAMGRSFWPMMAAFLRVGLLAAFTFGAVPLWDLPPESVFFATTVTSFVEGGLGLYLLRRFIRVNRALSVA
jgi:putative MATE family efflux protein